MKWGNDWFSRLTVFVTPIQQNQWAEELLIWDISSKWCQRHHKNYRQRSTNSKAVGRRVVQRVSLQGATRSRPWCETSTLCIDCVHIINTLHVSCVTEMCSPSIIYVSRCAALTVKTPSWDKAEITVHSSARKKQPVCKLIAFSKHFTESNCEHSCNSRSIIFHLSSFLFLGVHLSCRCEAFLWFPLWTQCRWWYNKSYQVKNYNTTSIETVWQACSDFWPLEDTLPQANQVSELHSKVTHPPPYRKSQIISVLPLAVNLQPQAVHMKWKERQDGNEMCLQRLNSTHPQQPMWIVQNIKKELLLRNEQIRNLRWPNT